MSSKPNVLIIEDDQRIAENISKGLQEKGFQTQIAYDGKMGLKFYQNGGFDLILLDLNLPVMNGYEVCEKVRETDGQTPIIMLTALGETEDKLEGFEKGADDYLVKPFDFRELVVRIGVLLKRKSIVANNSHQLKVADLIMDLDKKTVERDGKSIDLTPKEFSLLEFLINNKGRVVSKAEIAETVWDHNANQSLNVVEVYINFLRKKIDKSFASSLIHTKSGMGYLLDEEH
jgi:DNA-binding response OmpR family regulator